MESDEAKKQKQSSLNHSFAIAMFNFIGERKKRDYAYRIMVIWRRID